MRAGGPALFVYSFFSMILYFFVYLTYFLVFGPTRVRLSKSTASITKRSAFSVDAPCEGRKGYPSSYDDEDESNTESDSLVPEKKNKKEVAIKF